MVAAVRGFQCGSEASASAGQNSILWQTDSRLTTCIFLLSRLLSSPVHTSPLLSSSVRKGKGRQIRQLPQKVPITACQCIHRCCLRNAEFVNPIQLKEYMSSILAVLFLNESSTLSVWISECTQHT